MSFSCLPKELRLEIWTLAYFAQPPRLVALRTAPHDENHDETSFCPRYSPSPASAIANVCHEARSEALHQARRAGHLAHLRIGPITSQSCTRADFTEVFFRFETDILYLPLDDKHVKHFDDSPDNGLLQHFRMANNVDASKLRTIAITQVIFFGYDDGSLSNCLQQFPDISRIIMMVPDDVQKDAKRQPLFVRAARRIVSLYQFDLRRLYERVDGNNWSIDLIDVDFAFFKEGWLEIIPKQTWKDWSTLARGLGSKGKASFNL